MYIYVIVYIYIYGIYVNILYIWNYIFINSLISVVDAGLFWKKIGAGTK